MLVYTLANIHSLLEQNKNITKRYHHYGNISDLYYTNVNLYGKQHSLNKIIDDISFTFKIPRSKLNLVIMLLIAERVP